MFKKTIFIFLLICILIMPLSIFGEGVDLNKKCTLKIQYTQNDICFKDEPVELYKVAAVTTDFIFEINEEFKESGIVLNGAISNPEWKTIRETFENYILSKGIKPVKVNFTDDKGIVIFENLEPGMYFTSAVCTIKDNTEYRFSSCLSALPNLQNAKILYNVDIKAKVESFENTNNIINYKVIKLWKDSGHEHRRPKEIEVQIYKNKVLQDTVVLNDNNNWLHSWTAEADGSTWSVAEVTKTDKYRVTIENKVNSFVIVNKYDEDFTWEDVDTPPSTEKPPSDFDSPGTEVPTGDTVNLWSYILIMCMSGFLLIVISVAGKIFFAKNEDN